MERASQAYERLRITSQRLKEKATRNEEKSIEINANAVKELRDYAASKKAIYPEFRDLGETESSNVNVREYAVECRCMGKSATAIGKSKQDARFICAGLVLELLKNEEKPKRAQKSRRPGAKKPDVRRKK